MNKKDKGYLFEARGAWCNGKSTCLPRRWPGFDRTRPRFFLFQKIKKMCSHPLGYPTMWTLSHTMPVVMCSSVNTCLRGRQKERNHGEAIEIHLSLQKEISMNPSSTICEAKHRYKCVVWEARGKKRFYIWMGKFHEYLFNWHFIYSQISNEVSFCWNWNICRLNMTSNDGKNG